MKPELAALLLISFLVFGAGLGVALGAWMARSARRQERELLLAFGIDPDAEK